jgi:hypothetical protein
MIDIDHSHLQTSDGSDFAMHVEAVRNALMAHGLGLTSYHHSIVSSQPAIFQRMPQGIVMSPTIDIAP